MPYRVSFDLVFSKKDQSIHVVPTHQDETPCGLTRKSCVKYIGLPKLAWCKRCQEAYQERSEKDFIIL